MEMAKSKMPTRDELLRVSDDRTIAEVAAIYGVTTATVSIWRSRLRVATKNKARRPRLTEQELLRAGAGRRPDNEVAATLGVSRPKVIYWRQAYGIPGNAQVWRMRERWAKEAAEVLTVRLYQHERQALKERSKQAGVSVSDLVRRVLFGDGGTDE